MVSGDALLIAVVVGLSIWGGTAAVHGVKKAGHAIHCVFKPHAEGCEKPKDTQQP